MGQSAKSLSINSQINSLHSSCPCPPTLCLSLCLSLSLPLSVPLSLSIAPLPLSRSAQCHCSGPYSQAIKGGGFLFVSGCIGLDPSTGQLVPGGVVPQASQSLQNLVAILQAGGSSPSGVVKTTVLLSDMKDYAAVNEIYKDTFRDKPYPARAAFACKELPAGALVEIEAVALLKE